MSFNNLKYVCIVSSFRQSIRTLAVASPFLSERLCRLAMNLRYKPYDTFLSLLTLLYHLLHFSYGYDLLSRFSIPCLGNINKKIREFCLFCFAQILCSGTPYSVAARRTGIPSHTHMRAANILTLHSIAYALLLLRQGSNMFEDAQAFSISSALG